MKAIGFYHPLPLTDPESLIDLEIATPLPTGRDLLVNVHAVSVNPVDVKVRASQSQGEPSPHILGWDVAGVIAQLGSECTLFKPGDEVFYAGSIARPGGDSEFHLVDERIVGNKPKSLNFAQAAALPLTAITAWEALFDRLAIPRQAEQNAEKSLLIIGAAGGVGSIATQLGRLAGVMVIGTASRPESIQWAKEHGAVYTISHREAFALQLQRLGFEQVDYIFCLNSTEKHWRNMTEVIAPQGKICSIVEMEEPVDLTALQRKSATFVWEWMFTRPFYQTNDMIEQHHLLNTMADLVDAGKIQTTLTTRLSPITASNIRKAHELVEKGTMIGKVVLEQF